MSRTIWATCRNCDTAQECERDEDGAPDMETTVCHDDACTRRLCAHCPQFSCTSCGLSHCTSHRVRIGAEELCSVCVRAYIEDAAVEYAETMEPVEVSA